MKGSDVLFHNLVKGIIRDLMVFLLLLASL
jgi:hypothetical protein